MYHNLNFRVGEKATELEKQSSSLRRAFKKGNQIKRYLRHLPWLTCFFLGLTLDANETTIIDVPEYNLEAYKSSGTSCFIPKPYGFLINVNSIYKAKLDVDRNRGIQYAEGEVLGIYGFKVTPDTGLSAYLGAGIVVPRVKQNIHFSTNSFSQVNVGLSSFTTSFNRWFLQMGLNMQIDINEIHNRFAKGSRYSALIWGRYCLLHNLGFHIGAIIFTGVEQTTAYPILGIDYRPNCRWKLDLVFPIYPSVSYHFNPKWSIALSARPFISRDRLGNNDFIKNGIFEYRNLGTEFSLNYDYNLLVWSLHVGYSYGGSFQIRDSQSNLIQNFTFDGAPYVGANLLWRF